MTWLIIDLIFVAVIAVAAFVGKKRGFLMTVFSLATVAIAIVIAMVAQPVITGMLSGSGIENKMTETISESINEKCNKMLKDTTVVSTEQLADELSLPASLRAKLPSKNITAADMLPGGEISGVIRELAASISALIIKIMSFMILLVVIAVGLFVLKNALKLFTHLPVVGKLDSTLGLIVGILIGLLINFAVLALVQIFSSCGAMTGIQDAILGSKLTYFAYKNNLLFMLAIIL